MRSAFIDAWRHQWRVSTLCRMMRVSERGYRSWRARPICQRRRTDMAVLAHILDLHSRRVVGWAVSDRMKKDLAIRALDMAVRLRTPPPGCLFHSDRGSQYCSYDYQKKLQAHGLRPSMSGKGNCYDNASVETFFKSLKAELIWRQKWPTRRQAEAAIFQYINGFYNTPRRHSYLGGISPLAFEAKVA
jgi:putative transposase